MVANTNEGERIEVHNIKNKSIFTLNTAVIVIIVIGIGVILFSFFTPFVNIKGTFDTHVLSEYGAFIGGVVGVLFSLASFMLIYRTLRVQQEAIANQQKATDASLKTQQKAIASQKEATDASLKTQQEAIVSQQEATDASLKTQQKAITIQQEATEASLKIQGEAIAIQKHTAELDRFEITFFNMLNLQQQIIEGLTISFNERVFDTTWKWGKTSYKGRENFSRSFFSTKCVDAMGSEYPSKDMKNDPSVIITLNKCLSELGMAQYDQFNICKIFDHYFRHLYRIMKFVDERNLLDAAQKLEYISILEATLSEYELYWLFYHGISSYGNINLKPLIEKYSFLKNIHPAGLYRCKEYHAFTGDRKNSSITPPNNDFNLFVSTDNKYAAAGKQRYYISAIYPTITDEIKAKHNSQETEEQLQTFFSNQTNMPHE